MAMRILISKILTAALAVGLINKVEKGTMKGADKL
jgi:hypothetical protein